MSQEKRVGIIAGVFVALALALSAQGTIDLRRQNKILESELNLARGKGSYMIIDLEGKTISLRARGMVLRQWDIGKSRTWGKRIPMKTLKLERRSALRSPKRTNITPGKDDAKPQTGSSTSGAAAGPDLGILELDDMPVHYDLVFDGDVRVSIRPRSSRLGTGLINLGKSVLWYSWLPIKTVLRSATKKPFTEIAVVLPSEKAAREIYWSFLEGHQTLIIP
jgi:hypothetical protein